MLLVALALAVLTAAASADIIVNLTQPVTHRYVENVSGGDTTWVEVEITDIQQAIDLAYTLINHPFAGYPGHDNTVALAPGLFDSVSTFTTIIGVKTAIAAVPEGVVLRGQNRDGAVIDHREAEYGILLENVSAATVVENLTIVGGGERDRGRADDDVRDLIAAIACLDGTFATIRDVSIERSATGIAVHSLYDDAAPHVEGVLVARGSHHGILVKQNGETPVTILGSTIVDNFDIGVYVYDGSATIGNCSITHNGLFGIKGYMATPEVENSNLYHNDHHSDDPQNYGGTLPDLTGIDGNISDEPFYCDLFGDIGYVYSVCALSPNLPEHSGVGLIGAFGEGCTESECVSPVSEVSWGAIKALYR
jgi:hypothetical protein